MTTDEIDLVDQTLRPATSASAGQSVSPEFNQSESDLSPSGAVTATPSVAPEIAWPDPEAPATAPVSVVHKRRFRLRNPLARSSTDTRRRFRPAWFMVAFVLGALVSLALFAAVALGLSSYYNSRALPGVHVGSVDVSGLSRDEVIAKLQTGYAYLGQG